MAAITELQREVTARLRCGESFAQIEHEVIEASDLSEDYKSALWLYGWSSLDHRPLPDRQRRGGSFANT
jgi:hypothetical protein